MRMASTTAVTAVTRRAATCSEEFKKDPRRFEADSQYAQGWSDGFRQCESEEQAAQRQTRMVLEQQRLAQQREYDASQEQRHLEREVLKGIDTKGLENLK